MNSQVDYKAFFREVLKRRRIFYITLPLTFIISSLYIVCVPRQYTSETKVAPESGSSSQNGMLGSIASSFGVDLSNIESTDAITPMIYPELLEDNMFIASLFNIKLKSIDGSINTDFYTYINKYQKYPWWTNCAAWIRNQFISTSPTQPQKRKYDPYILSKKESDIVEGIRSSLKINVDKKTGVITINTKAQDPLICKTIADSTREHLQQFIIKYRTNKARTDYDYYHKLTIKAKHDYEKSRQLYASFSDANSEVMLQSIKSKLDDMENEMQLKFNTYSTLNTQQQMALAKVQERTPAFTLVKGASMPIKPSSPKRMIFVLTMSLLAFFATSAYIMRDILVSKQ